MNCYIRYVLLVDSALTEGNIDISSLEIAVNNYPKHEQAIVRVEGDSDCGEAIIGTVQRIYIANNCLYGDIKFTRDWKFVVTRLIYNPFPLATIAGVINVPDLTYLDKVDFISRESNACSVAIDLDSIVGEQEYAYWLFNRPRYDHAQEATQRESVVLFNKKYDNEKTGFAGYVNINKEKPSNYYDIKENNSVITFDNEGEDFGNGIMRYGHYYNGALMGYVVCGVTGFGGDHRPRHPLDILEKFVEHQRKKNN
ncbi:hypothetical protein DU054_15905 [Salmonella enterica subsp. enterica serovar Bareilly]|nr:hypothetical protein [Salmonella enterica subsp. enterica serovar Bareilly]